MEQRLDFSAVTPRLELLAFFAHSHVKLASSQAAKKGLHCVRKLKISSVAPPRGTCFTIHHWLIEIGTRREEKAQLLVGIEFGTS